ncbi:hypothetical protein MRS60_12740 [Burkholderia pyrrocinia]|uniref:hypothetical protein n=1 Tax=Burkholderia pyrrocinia TaxID=60550 RepID=UPI001FB1F7BA|nr:hypothetical protein [Burkholderia pyrrocinia]UOB54751.1 hypothetical protein MRS60_12740 [Burkholderia pyrrocinia]
MNSFARPAALCASRTNRRRSSPIHFDDMRHAIALCPIATDTHRALRRIPNLCMYNGPKDPTMIRTIAALAALSTLTGTANAADTGTASGTAHAKQRYVSPGIANITGAAAPRPESASPDARCRELAAGIDAVTHAPDRGQKIVRGIGPDGKPRNELRAYDKRADLETEHQRLGCR